MSLHPALKMLSLVLFILIALPVSVSFADPLIISDISPNTGPTAGGQTVIITGTSFIGVNRVTIGGTSVQFTVDSPTQITATTPPHASGLVSVIATIEYSPSVIAIAEARNIYNYTSSYVPPSPPPTSPQPTINSISPISGPTSGGQTVTITGNNFIGITSVTIGGSTATFTVNSTSQITATTPPHASGAASVAVTNNAATAFAPNIYTYSSTYVPAPPPPATNKTTTSPTAANQTAANQTAANKTTAGPKTTDQTTRPAATSPIITSISPNSGPAAGGQNVTITGTGLSFVTSVMFGEIFASFTVNSPTQITAAVPRKSPGVVRVTVYSSYGSGSIDYTYLSLYDSLLAKIPVGAKIPGQASILISDGQYQVYVVNPGTDMRKCTASGLGASQIKYGAAITVSGGKISSAAKGVATGPNIEFCITDTAINNLLNSTDPEAAVAQELRDKNIGYTVNNPIQSLELALLRVFGPILGGQFAEAANMLFYSK